MLPFAAAQPVETLSDVETAGSLAPMPMLEEIRPAHFVQHPAPQAPGVPLELAAAPTLANAAVGALPLPGRRRNLQMIISGALGLGLLLLLGVLVFAAYRGITTATPPPIHTISTTPGSLPTKHPVTPASSAGSPLGRTPVPGTTPGSTPAATPSPVVTPGTTPTPVTVPPTPTPLPIPSPTAIPTVVGTP